ncbi:MAG: prolipoprotein diacylglyceryl transferase [Firmicutes bacterium]|nr:prolipoprotein diacylglyceryl transferase [Bacillota bacterium]
MRPVLFSLFGLPVYSYGLFLALAVGLVVYLAQRKAPRAGFSSETIIDLALVVAVGALLGAPLAFVLVEWDYYRTRPWEIVDFRAGGLSFFGAFGGGFLAARLYAARKKLPFWSLVDFSVPYVALAYAIGRLGCLLNGCCYGVPSRVPWALACRAGDPTLRHPTQIYASLGGFFIFLLLYRLRNHRRFPGFLFFLYLGLYALMRGVVETFRDSRILFGFVRLTHLACLAVALLAGIEIWRREKRWQRKEGEKTGGAEMDSRAGAGGPAA